MEAVTDMNEEDQDDVVLPHVCHQIEAGEIKNEVLDNLTAVARFELLVSHEHEKIKIECVSE
jgi:hypothetical protein